MNTHVDKTHVNKSQLVSNGETQVKRDGQSTSHFSDNKPEAIAQRKLQEMANSSPEIVQRRKLQEMGNNSPHFSQLRALQEMANNSPQVKQMAQLQAMANNHSAQQHQPIQKKENNTGLPDNLKTGMENLSGMSLDDVKVHRNSDKPAQLQAHAYAKGTDIHLGPGQEKHLPHEAWHVVQQKQGRVKPTVQLKGKVYINDDPGLEKEADVMGNKAQVINKLTILEKELKTTASSSNLIQAMKGQGLLPSKTPSLKTPEIEVEDGKGSDLTQPVGPTSHGLEVTTKPPGYSIEQDSSRIAAEGNLGIISGTMQKGNTELSASLNAPSAGVTMDANGLKAQAKLGSGSGQIKSTMEGSRWAATLGVGGIFNLPGIEFDNGKVDITKPQAELMYGFGVSRKNAAGKDEPIISARKEDGFHVALNTEEIKNIAKEKPDPGLVERVKRSIEDESLLDGQGNVKGTGDNSDIDAETKDLNKQSLSERIFEIAKQKPSNKWTEILDRSHKALDKTMGENGAAFVGLNNDNDSDDDSDSDDESLVVNSTPVAETEDLKEKGLFDNFISWWNRPVDPRDERLSGVDSDSSDDTHYSSDDTTKTTVDSPESNNDSQANTPDSDSDDDSDFWDEPYHDY